MAMTAINQPTLLKTLVIGTLLGVAAGSAIAQQPPSAPAEVTGLDEIIVYAQKKSVGEAVQTVPVAEMAISGLVLDQEHLQDLSQIGRLMPNVDLNAGTYPLYPNFNIRGVGNASTTRSIDPSVNIIQDGMVLGYQAGAVLDAFDMESVEVLRGPQGVLFGRNASGGRWCYVRPCPRPILAATPTSRSVTGIRLFSRAT
jgi:iron complex outermembrane receptor protein